MDGNPKIRNEEIKQRIGVEGLIMDDVKRKQLVWYGYVQRIAESRLPKQVMERVPGKMKKRETQNNVGNGNKESNK